MLLEVFAADLVRFTSELLDGRTVNIMNTEGVIIASTESHRIGTFHQGAWEAASSGKPVSIRKDQVSQYPGAREGYNMPIRAGNTVIGVVGIFGSPEQIKELAHLVEVYAEKCYQVEALIQSRYAQSSLRNMLLGKLLTLSREHYNDVAALMKAQNIKLRYPAAVVICSRTEGQFSPEDADSAVCELPEIQDLDPAGSLWGVLDGRIVAVLSQTDAAKIRFPDRDFLRVSISAPADSIWDVRNAYEQALILDSIGTSPVNTLQDLETRCRYNLYCTALKSSDYLDALYQQMENAIPAPERKTILLSAQYYFDNDRSVTKAASLLYVHKNTLQYRIRRLMDALNITDAPAFSQEYTIRLLLEHYKRKQGLRALK